MIEAQGPNIAEWQAQQQHQEQQREKSGFGLGYGDCISTIVDGMKWLFNFHEGAISAYCNVFEGLIDGSSLAKLLGKSGNMFGIKFFENLVEHFSGGGSWEDILPEGIDVSHINNIDPNPDNYPHASSEMVLSSEGLHNDNMYGDDVANHHRRPFFLPSF